MKIPNDGWRVVQGNCETGNFYQEVEGNMVTITADDCGEFWITIDLSDLVDITARASSVADCIITINKILERL